MRKINKKDMSTLKPYEDVMRTAIDTMTYRGLTNIDLTRLSGLYLELLDQRTNISCGTCVLDMLVRLGRLYFREKERLNNEHIEHIKLDKENERNTYSIYTENPASISHDSVC